MTGSRRDPLAGTGALARLAFRRDRIMLPAWVVRDRALASPATPTA